MCPRHPDVRAMFEEWQTLTTNRTRDLWGAEATIIRPGAAE